MEPKKNPVYDVHRYRSALFTVGLMTSIAIVIMAFEWKTEVKSITKCDFGFPPEELTYTVPSTDHVYKSNPVVKPITTPIDFIEVKEVTLDPSDEIVIVDMSDPLILPTSLDEVPTETVSDPFIFIAEVMPEPQSGFSGFYKLLKQSLKYPKKAQEQRTEGKVFVEFIVNEHGDLSDFKVLKGIGSGCDEEAIRVLKLSKWKPGKQRGNPVKVKMVLPIHFKLNPQ